MNNQIYHLKSFLIFSISILISINISAQDWESIPTPVTSNLILYGITFPSGQNNIGFTGGASSTFNGQGKIMKTTNEGTDWAVIWESAVSGTGVSSIQFLTVNNGFAGTQGGDLMTTTNGGISWTSVDIDPALNQGAINDIKFFDMNNGLLLTQWEGVYITSNGGTTWVPATVDVTGGVHELAYADASNVFAVGNQQTIFKSTNGGITWSTNFTGSNGGFINLGIHFFDSNNGLVTSEEGDVFVTSNGGTSWSAQSVVGQSGLMNGALVANPNEMYVTATPGSVYKSIDGGNNWTLDSPFDPNPSYYTIIMTDNGNLFVSGSGSSGGTILRKLAEAGGLNVTATPTDVTCNGGSDGSITLSVSGGDLPYSYNWSNGSTSPNLTGLTAGVYACTVTDNLSATAVVNNINVLEPPAISISFQTANESYIGAADGTITCIASGGTSPYNYSWDNGASVQTITGLESGTYCVTVTDLNSCFQSDCVTIVTNICDLTILQQDQICNDAGTSSNPTDDFYTITVNAIAVNGGPGNLFNVLYNGSIVGTFIYNIGGSFNLPADGSFPVLTFEDAVINTCNATTTLGKLDACSFQCILSITQTDIDCNDNGTTAIPSDDFFVVTVNATAVNPGPSNSFNVLHNGSTVGTYTYNLGGSFILAADGSSPTLVFIDVDDNSCFSSTLIGPLVSCSFQCILTITQSDAECNDNQTPFDSSDDFYTVSVNATAVNPGPSNSFNVLHNGSPVGTYTYNVGETFNLPADGSSPTLVFIDVDNPTCFATTQIGPLLPCSVDCPPTLTIDDNPITDDTYQADQTIFSAGKIPSLGDVVFKAGDVIHLEIDFEVESNATFTAENEGCQ